jgi:hypothetical protein
MMGVQLLVEYEMTGKTGVLEENVPQRSIVHHKSHITWPRIEPGTPDTNRLTYGRDYSGGY